MLGKLTIQNYALIENLDADFPDGLVIITGETGAGKSILLGALSLLLGAKADVSVLKDPARNCVVEGEFDITDSHIPAELLGEEPEEGEERDSFCENGRLLLRRVISPGGRSRSFINDRPVPNATLAALAGRLVDVHAQHQHLLLSDGAYQLSVLDYFAGTAGLLEEYKKTYSALQEARNALANLCREMERMDREIDYKQYQFDKLEQARLRPGEREELEAEQKQLANAEEIKNSLYGAAQLMRPMGTSLVQNLKDAAHILRKCSNFVPAFEELASRLETCRIECRDIEEELERRAEEVTVSPDRLEKVESRMGEIELLLKKYGCTDVESLIAVKDGLERELLDAGTNQENKLRLEAQVEQLEKDLERQAEKLSEKRAAKTRELGHTLEEKIKDLEMPFARFEVELTPADHFTPQGKDRIRFMFSANGTEKTTELARVASGGELSRIMLCLKSLMAAYTGMPTLIFDEIDTGVSGRIADKMGKLIGELGENMQVFAITHLPQIASKGDTHLLVYKEFDDRKRAHTKIKRLEGQERVMEIARMLSGSELSEAAVENAKYLLKK